MARARCASSCGAVSARSSSILDTSPDFPRNGEHEVELAAGVVLRHSLPGAAAAGEAALRRQAELLERHMLCRFLYARDQVRLLLEHRRLGRHQAEDHAL